MLIQEQRTPVATPVATPVGNPVATPVATPVLLDPLPILVTVDDPPPTVEPKAPNLKNIFKYVAYGASVLGLLFSITTFGIILSMGVFPVRSHATTLTW